MYVDGNPKTKKALKQLVADAQANNPVLPRGPRAISPGPFPCKENGVEFFEGPHYPEPHRWYATCTAKDGVIVKVK